MNMLQEKHKFINKSLATILWSFVVISLLQMLNGIFNFAILLLIPIIFILGLLVNEKINIINNVNRIVAASRTSYK
jgi:membrane protein required for beta-lactamase induction